MIKRFLTVTLLSVLVLVSCKQNPKPDNQTMGQTEQTASTDEIVTNSVTNKDGTKLDMRYNNTKGTATFVLNGETIELKADTMASGVKYSNNQYVYTEHQGQIELKKDGKVVYEKKDDIVKNTLTNKAGEKLDMTFNNTTGMATFVLKGETIELKADTVASGVKFSNDNYVFIDHQGKAELKKDGKLVFQSMKK